MMSGASSPHRPRRWSSLLTAHAVAAAASALSTLVLLAAGLQSLGELTMVPLSLLGFPWSFLVLFAPLPWVTMSNTEKTLVLLATAGLAVAVHWLALAVVRERRHQRARATLLDVSLIAGAASAPYPLGHLGGTILLGAGIWAAWLGWDTSSYEIPGRPGLHGPHTAAQVVACALTVGLATALLTLRNDPEITALGISLGFGAGWTISALVQSEGPSTLFGAALLAVVLITGTALAASVGYVLRRPLETRRARRGELVPRT